MRIAFFEVREKERAFIEDYMRSSLKGHKAAFFTEALSKENVKDAAGADIVSIIGYSGIDESMLKSMPRLKMIAVRATGFESVNLEACRKRKIVVSNVPFYAENTVAEHAFALMLSISRNVHKAYTRMTQGEFGIDGLRGFDLRGKTLGVVGAGRIGLHVIRIAKAFSMNVIAFDVKKDDFMAEVFGFEYVPMDRLLAESDIITLHAPYNMHTHHVIDRKAMKKMKKGVILINTARGGLIDTKALIDFLDNGTIAGVGLDVIEGEEMIKEDNQLLYDDRKLKKLAGLVKNNILIRRYNVVYTPHIAFYSKEAFTRKIGTTCENIRAFVKKGPQNVIS